MNVESKNFLLNLVAILVVSCIGQFLINHYCNVKWVTWVYAIILGLFWKNCEFFKNTEVENEK